MLEGKPDIVIICEQEGIELRQRGRSLWGLCPFHDDRTPSFTVDPEKQRFKCFGCGAGGDVIDFIQRLHSLDFKDALKHLGMTPGKPPQVNPKERRKRELLRDFERWRKDAYTERCDLVNDVWHVLRACTTMEEISHHAPMIHDLSRMQGEIEILSEGSDEQRYELYHASTGF
jgi:hypothetical protein